MRIPTVTADRLKMPDLGTAVGITPYSGDVVVKASTVRSSESVLNQSLRREVLAEALLDGFLGDDNADYAGLVAFTRRLRDHNPTLAVQLLKPLLRTEATPSVNVEQQAVFIFGELPQQSDDGKENKSLPPNDDNVLDVE